jgi:transcriptional regulator with XRE-family HTH domain
MTGGDAMDMWGFLKWRRTLGYTQKEAADKLGVSRGSIQHWERGVTPVPRAVELACQELTRRWKQQPEFGPVNLVYAHGAVAQQHEDSAHSVLLQSEPYSSNEAAIGRVLELSQTPNFTNPAIMEEGGGVVWTPPELLRECERRNVEKRQKGSPPQARAGPSTKRLSTQPTSSESTRRDRRSN